MQTDWSKLFLFVVLSLVVLVLVSPSTLRPLAAAPKDSDKDLSEDASETEPSLVTRGAGWIGVATHYGRCPPLALMMPRQGGAAILPR